MKKKELGKNEMGFEEKKRDKPKTNIQNNIQERSHLEGGQESKLVDAQTRLQPNQTKQAPTKLANTLALLPERKTRRRMKREAKRMNRNEEESYL